MARPRTTCVVCKKQNKTPHGLYMHELRIHKGRNWNHDQFIKAKKAA